MQFLLYTYNEIIITTIKQIIFERAPILYVLSYIKIVCIVYTYSACDRNLLVPNIMVNGAEEVCFEFYTFIIILRLGV